MGIGRFIERVLIRPSRRMAIELGLLQECMRDAVAQRLLQEYVNAADCPRCAIDVVSSDEWRYHWLCRVREYLAEVRDGR